MMTIKELAHLVTCWFYRLRRRTCFLVIVVVLFWTKSFLPRRSLFHQRKRALPSALDHVSDFAIIESNDG
jgi:hypothetical protein